MWSALTRKLSRRAANWQRSWIKRTHIAQVLDAVPEDAVILEIGGGYNPRYRKSTHPHTYHLDHASTAELRVKYASDPTVAHQVDNIQKIDFVFVGDPIETLVPASLRFDVIYGSHVLEHQVDLIGHLQSLEKLLKPGGRVIEIIPDLRACFDALRFPTVTSDALLVHLKKPRVHQGKQVFDCLSCEVTANIGRRMIAADFEGVTYRRGVDDAWRAMLDAELADATYQDTHAWTFTPESFRLLMIELRLLGLVRLAPTSVSPRYGNQFCTVLERVSDGPDGPDETTRASLERERLQLAIALRI